MLTGEIHVLPTDTTPEFLFCSDGMFKIRGRGLYKNKPEAENKLTDWVAEYTETPAEITYVNIFFEYLNSLSTIMLVSFLRKLAEVTLQSKKLLILWYYEEDDEDMFERGEYISTTFNIPFTFVPVRQIAELS
jgi:hypothetical protein